MSIFVLSRGHTLLLRSILGCQWKAVDMSLRKAKRGSFKNLVHFGVPVILIGGFLSIASFAHASTYTEPVNLGAAAEYTVVAGAAITIGTGTVLLGETISDVSGRSSGPWMAATLASANASIRTATSTSAATNFPVNRRFTAGVYKYTSYMSATGEITLDAQNDPNAVFIFQVGGYLSTEAGFSVLLTNGANPANVYWQIDSYFVPGASTNFKGIVMAGAYITTGADVILNGKMFALGGAVTIGASNVISNSLLNQFATWNSSLAVPSISSPIVLDVATGSGGGLVSYVVTDPGTTGCTIVSSTRTLSYTSSGSCTVTATIASTDTYEGTVISKTFLLTVPSVTTSVPSTNTTVPSVTTSVPSTTPGIPVGSPDGSGLPLKIRIGGTNGIPIGASAVALNVTVVDTKAPSSGGYVTVYPCGVRPNSSNLNFLDGQTMANSVMMPMSDSGDVCFYVYGIANLIVDVNGYVPSFGFATMSAANSRLLDTRLEATKVGMLDGTGAVKELQITGVAGIPAGISAVAMNVTAVDTESSDMGGYVTVYPCGTRPTTSNINFVGGQTIPNSIIAPVSASGKICFYVYGKADILADVSGYFPTGSLTSLTKPERLLDTRQSRKVGALDGSGVVKELQVSGVAGIPAGISAVAMNVTAVNSEANNYGGYVSVYPCGTRPNTSTLNFTAGQTVPNGLIAPVSSAGKICIYVYGKADILIDVSAYMTLTNFTSLTTPVRIRDTRQDR
jgi:hypothetical protein